MKRGRKICAICGKSLPAPHPPGEKRCVNRSRKHRVYMFFFERHGWHSRFLEEDCKTPLPRKLNFESPEKIFELAMRPGAVLNLEEHQAIEHTIRNGCGGIWLELSEDQYTRSPNGDFPTVSTTAPHSYG